MAPNCTFALDYTWHLSQHDVYHPSLLLRNTKVSCVWSTLLVYSSTIWWCHVVTQYRWIPRSGVDWIMLCGCMQYFPFSCRRVWQWVHVLCSGWQATTSTLINSSWSPLHSPPNSCPQPQENTHPRCLFSGVQSMHVQTDRNRMKSWVWGHPHPYESGYIFFITMLRTWDTVPNSELTQTQTLKLKTVLCYWVEFLGAKSQASLLPRGPAFHLAVVTLQVKKKVMMEYN